MKFPRNRHVSGMLVALLAASAALGAPASNAERSNQEEQATRIGLPAESSHSAEAEIDAFVQRVRGAHRGAVAPAVDWKGAEILLAASESAVDELVQFEGMSVGGLTVRVVSAKFTPALMDAAITRISGTSFRHASLVESFSVSRDGSTLIVNVQGLDGLGQAEESELERTLVDLASGDVELMEAPIYRNL